MKETSVKFTPFIKTFYHKCIKGFRRLLDVTSLNRLYIKDVQIVQTLYAVNKKMFLSVFQFNDTEDGDVCIYNV